MQWSSVGAALKSQDVQTLPFETVDFQTITQGQHLIITDVRSEERQ